MRALTWFVRLILFLLLFGLALNNLEPTVLHLLFGTQWRAPLFVLLLAAFTLGVVLGALAMLPAWLRARRGAQARATSLVTAPPPPAATPPHPPGVIDGSTDGV
ncbi:hypothetical protein GALL_305040 [mine drainage metagenome]|jgi:uncharacterized integral membrane protein|uniref:Lipopolysaccharide assembly protein A domain-containing protein n=1 Tax=mine drainage metagenome TaxID=410659 RepID=A0A1J5QVA6_9ZZZZ